MRNPFAIFFARASPEQDAVLQKNQDENTDLANLDAIGELGHTQSPDGMDYWTSALGTHSSIDDSAQILATALWQRTVHERCAKASTLLAALPLPVLTAARVGAQFWAARNLPFGKPLHVMAGNKLVAVLDTISHQVGLRPDLKPEDLSHLHTSVMPESAKTMPAGFVSTYLWDLIWQYAQHDPAALLELPAQVAYQSLHMRRLPAVAPRLLEPRHTTVMRCMLKEKWTFEQLLERTEIPAHQLCHDVAALVLTRSVFAG